MTHLINTEADLKAGLKRLIKLDPRLAELLAVSGTPPLRRRRFAVHRGGIWRASRRLPRRPQSRPDAIVTPLATTAFFAASQEPPGRGMVRPKTTWTGMGQPLAIVAEPRFGAWAKDGQGASSPQAAALPAPPDPLSSARIPA